MAWAKPDIVDVSGSPIVQPPFEFREVTARVFPLKANISRLAQFCDDYLNMDIPEEIVRYAPALPYVYLMVLNYGSMYAASVKAQNAGWVAQHEVTFTVPLQQWQRENGKLVFKGWASVSPFIYVDDQLSQMTGREVYGWPKVLGKIDSDVPLWTTHPRKPTRLFTLSTHVFRYAYAGQEEKMSPLIHVDYDPPGTFSKVPLNAWNPWSPLSIVPNAIRNSLSLMGEAVDILMAQRVRGYQNDLNLSALLTMALKGGAYFRDFMPELMPSLLSSRAKRANRAQDANLSAEEAKLTLPRLLLDNVTLKQFRDPEKTDLACYQALVSSKMGVERINQAGLLGDPGLLRGDPSGGYTIRLHKYNAQPIIEVLGIEVPGIEEDAGSGPVAILKPTLPIWSDTDLWYGKGELICSRENYREAKIGGRPAPHGDNRGRWIDERDPKLKTAHPWVRDAAPNATPIRQDNSASVQEKSGIESDGAGKSAAPAPPYYNTSLGAATQPVVGPFHFPDVHVQVYPLLADQAKLDGFVDWYLNETLEGSDPRLRFKVAGSYVYLVVSVVGDKHGTMWSATNNIGWWAQREVSFCVPVKWYEGDEDEKSLISMAVVEPFVYADNGRAVITDREVNGRSSFHADIYSPRDIWNSEGPAANRQVLHMETEMFSAVNAGQKSTMGGLLDIDEGDVFEPGDEAAWRAVQNGWGSEAAKDLRRKTLLASTQFEQIRDAKSLALEILAQKAPINRITLKQYRDATDISKACYQAAVHVERSITQIYNIREIEERMHVRITRVPGHPIVERLGLKVKSVNSRQGHVVETLQPIRPFWMHVEMKEELGRVIGTAIAVNTDDKPPKPLKRMNEHDWETERKVTIGNSNVVDADAHKDKWTKQWVLSHKWFNEPAPATADTLCSKRTQAPFFLSPGARRVGRSLADRADEQHQYLTNLSNNWLRRSLTNEMAWIRGQSPARLDPQLQKSDRDQLEQLRHSASVGDYCSGASTGSLLTLSAAITQALPTIWLELNQAEHQAAYEREFGASSRSSSKAPSRAASSRLLTSLKTVAEWLDAPFNKTGAEKISAEDRVLLKAALKELPAAMKQVVTNLEQLPPWGRIAAETVLTTHNRERIDDLERYAKEKTLASLAPKYLDWWKLATRTALDAPPRRSDEISGALASARRPDLALKIEEAESSVVQLQQATTDWLNLDQWRRMSREEARKSIHELADAQIVLESILSDEWENNGFGMRWTLDGDRRRPDHSLPVASIGPDLGNSPWSAEQGLSVWPEQRDDRYVWEFVARRGRAKAKGK